eukprot:4927320-Prymnesium_polylepis.1
MKERQPDTLTHTHPALKIAKLRVQQAGAEDNCNNLIFPEFTDERSTGFNVGRRQKLPNPNAHGAPRSTTPVLGLHAPIIHSACAVPWPTVVTPESSAALAKCATIGGRHALPMRPSPLRLY